MGFKRGGAGKVMDGVQRSGRLEVMEEAVYANANMDEGEADPHDRCAHSSRRARPRLTSHACFSGWLCIQWCLLVDALKAYRSLLQT